MKERQIRIFCWLIIVIAGVFLILQLIRPAKTNPTRPPSQAIDAHLQVSPQVASILGRSCNDCHSNNTSWPWYSNVAPVSWFVIDHVNHGRRHLNFSEWSRYSQRDANNLLGSICKEVQSGSMPLSSYLQLHRHAKLSLEDIKTLCDWASVEQPRVASP